ncbi:MAG: GIY-YIG nuclease family protein [Chitinophagaceae bacterium]|nr:GIY-YIG nuclease family protein [Chitinophagaceae bacterium]
MFYVYILYSEKCDRYYVGFSADVHARLIRHNCGLVPATKNCFPYKLCAYKTFETEAEARKEEFRIKKQKAADAIYKPGTAPFYPAPAGSGEIAASWLRYNLQKSPGAAQAKRGRQQSLIAF